MIYDNFARLYSVVIALQVNSWTKQVDNKVKVVTFYVRRGRYTTRKNKDDRWGRNIIHPPPIECKGTSVGNRNVIVCLILVTYETVLKNIRIGKNNKKPLALAIFLTGRVRPHASVNMAIHSAFVGILHLLGLIWSISVKRERICWNNSCSRFVFFLSFFFFIKGLRVLAHWFLMFII